MRLLQSGVALLLMTAVSLTAADAPKKADVLRDLQARRVTLTGNVTLAEALAALAKQTGQAVADRRLEKSAVRFKLNLDKAPFWQALDAIAKAARSRVSLYEADGKLALRSGASRELPTSYQGMFRTQVKEVVVRRDFENGAHQCDLLLEMAWEPRFRPLFMTRPAGIEITDAAGKKLAVQNPGTGREAVTSPLATRISLRLQAPARSVGKLGLIKGKMSMVGPAEMLAFTIADLDKLDAPKALPAQKGVKATVEELVRDGTKRWSVTFRLDYPADGPRFQSFESWLVNTQAFLVDPKGNRHGTEEFAIDDQTSHRARMTFHFIGGKNGLTLGKPTGWKLALRTPGPIGTVEVPFEFKDVELP